MTFSTLQESAHQSRWQLCGRLELLDTMVNLWSHELPRIRWWRDKDTQAWWLSAPDNIEWINGIGPIEALGLLFGLLSWSSWQATCDMIVAYIATLCCIRLTLVCGTRYKVIRKLLAWNSISYIFRLILFFLGLELRAFSLTTRGVQTRSTC